MVSLYALFGIVTATTSLALLAALAGWYYCLNNYREEMSDRAHDAMKWALPPFLLLSASPLFDVVFWLAGYSFPVIGARGLVVGLGGVAIVLGYVVYDLRLSDSTASSGIGTSAR